MVDSRDLRYFAAVAETLSFTRAAERLGIAQPPLSRQIAALEARLGVLLLRRSRPLELTEAGRFLFEQARQVLLRIEEIDESTRRIGSGQRGFFGIGFVGSTLYGPLPRAIRCLRDEHPDVEIGLHELTTSQQREALQARRIDVGFGRINVGETPGLVHETLFDEPLRLACAYGHVLAIGGSVSLAQVATQPFVLYPARPRPSYADQVLNIFHTAGLKASVVLEANDLQTALGLVATGVGVTLVPASVSSLRRDDISFVSLDAVEAHSPVILSYRRDDLSALLRRFLIIARGA